VWLNACKFVICARFGHPNLSSNPIAFISYSSETHIYISQPFHLFYLFQFKGIMAAPNAILVDVRTPAEFATGYLSADTTDAINIEYQLIEQLPLVLSERGIDLQKTDAITLYCRSGRRSNIALQTLKQLGYSKVRDIGGFEEARAVLKREEALRGLDQGDVIGVEVEKKEDVTKKEARAKSFGNLLAGLKGLE
jgi:rhodanese-related sulfurtransferase